MWEMLAAFAILMSGAMISVVPAYIDHPSSLGWWLFVLSPVPLVIWDIAWVLVANPPDTVRRIISTVIGALAGAVMLFGVTEMLKHPASAQPPNNQSGGTSSGSTTSVPDNKGIVAPDNKGIIAPDNKGIITQGQTGGENKIIQEDTSPRRRMRDLFNKIDPNILGMVEQGQYNLPVRMQPYEIKRLESLIAEAGSASDVTIRSVGPMMRDSTINNGSLGTTRSVPLQGVVSLVVQPTILLGPPATQ